ncbi:hypothetical protein HDU67_005711 [Dinochytrium kinnereticum]|nr:hypothetical protein HDU67_005711 [Dinochytrium kinnereticum]
MTPKGFVLSSKRVFSGVPAQFGSGCLPSAPSPFPLPTSGTFSKLFGGSAAPADDTSFHPEWMNSTSQAEADMMDLSWDTPFEFHGEKKSEVSDAYAVGQRRSKRRGSNGGRKLSDRPHRVSLKHKLSAKDFRNQRALEFFRRNKRDHNRIVARNRGLYFEDLPDHSNLGMFLNITHKLIRDLDADPDQSVPPLPSGFIRLKDPSRMVVMQGIYDEESILGSKHIHDDFVETDHLVRNQFSEKNVVADLKGVVEDDFALEYAKDVDSGKILGAAEFVQMKRYLWLDHIAVDREARGLGVGVALLNRLKYIAAYRKKQLLCFALHDVVDWYVHQGFASAERDFPLQPWHIGRFLVYTPPGVEVPVPKVENYSWMFAGR